MERKEKLFDFYTRSIMTARKICAIVQHKKKKDTKSGKEENMKTMLFADYLNSESHYEALPGAKRQSLDFMYSYRIRKRRKEQV